MTPAELEQRRTAAARARAVSHARARARTAERIEDLEDLLAAGVPLEDAIARVGWTPMAARSALTRRRHPLARPVNRLVHRTRTKETPR